MMYPATNIHTIARMFSIHAHRKGVVHHIGNMFEPSNVGYMVRFMSESCPQFRHTSLYMSLTDT